MSVNLDNNLKSYLNSSLLIKANNFSKLFNILRKIDLKLNWKSLN